uniref:Putative DNA binding, helix-turn-helix domain containing protein n=1 Tax=viral metagenome TaxID=1070528 RepID=A0A6M3KV09_9ZZZZ
MKGGNMTPAEIKEYRYLNRLSQTTLAELIGVSRQTVSNWERNLRKPNGHGTYMLNKLKETK